MATTRVAILDDANLSRDAFRHCISVADNSDLFALRCLKHCKLVYYCGKCVGVESTEALVYEKVLE